MKIKKLFTFIFGVTVVLANAGKPVSTAAKTNQIKENITQQIMLLESGATESNEEDPEVIFNKAIEDYKEEFDDYIDVTGLNVEAKESITLPNFNINYIAPDYSDIMYQYQSNLESSLTSSQLKTYDELRKNNYAFDKYVALNQNKYVDLTTLPKYEHIVTVAAVTMTLVGILSGAGLGEAAISAFTGAVSALSAALSTSWIPIVGWALAIGLAVGALIALTVIIVQHWEEICSVFEDIKAWFLEEFSVFSYLINSYFDDAKTKVEESTNVGTVSIGERTLKFEQVYANDIARQAVLVKKVRWTADILLMQYVGEKGFQICPIPVDFDYCKNTKTHLNGYSSYTWYQNKARALIIFAGTGVTTAKPEIDAPCDSSKVLMKHFHNCHLDEDKKPVRAEEQPAHRSHSFFGQLYYYPSGSKEPVVHPDSPEANPNAK